MPPLAPHPSLSDADWDRLEELLKLHEGAMNIEEMDGFLSAAIAGPEPIMLSEFLPYVLGGDDVEFGSPDQAQEFVELLVRRWNDIAGTLAAGDVCMPILLEDPDGVARGNDWADGFLLGTRLRQDGWNEMTAEGENVWWMAPVMVLHHEHDSDPELRPPEINTAMREELIVHMVAGLSRSYQYFQSRRVFVYRLGTWVRKGLDLSWAGDILALGSANANRRQRAIAA